LTGHANCKYDGHKISEPFFRKGAEPVSTHDQSNRRQVIGFLGLAFDNEDGHKRLTRTEHFLLVGGSAETHEKMQDTAVRFDEGLRQRGKALQEVSAEEAAELLHRAVET
jgi:hypothetical protein